MKLNTLTKFLLIAHHPEKGRFLTSETHLKYGIIGAALLEMSLSGLIKVENKKIVLLKEGNTENSVIAAISKEISTSKKHKKLYYWITILARKSHKYRWEALSDLESNHLVRIEKRKFLGLIPYKKSYLTAGNTRENLIYQLKQEVILGKDLSHETIVMLGLIEACNIQRVITTDRHELRKIRKSVWNFMREKLIAETVEATLQQIQIGIIHAINASTNASRVNS